VGKDLGLIWRNIKSFTALKIIDAIIKNPKESRKEHLLHTFSEAGKSSSSNFKYKFWEHENHPVLLDTTEMYNQRLNYLHWNPVTAGFVAEPWHWVYSSAIDYFTERKGLLDIIILDGF
jgi:putative transposase